jgi:ATP adenylyltransferase
MDYLWTPWRYRYLTTSDQQVVCVFCAAAQSSDDQAHLVAHRAVHNFVILNRYPYTSGHMMIVPYRHVASLHELDGDTLSEMMLLAQAAETHLRALYHPDGMNIGMNLGKSAGAGIAGHLHMHALPRWTGDSNFMTVIGETRVLPEDLEITWQRLSAAFAGSAAPPPR